ncbi:MAG: MFS transporter [Burkholderiales bacterium]|nr:MFS transporter [Burkholderiales bacterium]
MATVLCGISLCVLDGTVMNLALPAVARDMHVGASEVIWVVNAYQVAILALLLPLARLGDLYGYRKVYLSGLALFTLSSLACVLSRTLPWLSLARAFQGMGAAGMFAINAALVRAIYPRLQLGRGIALNSAVVGIASVAGPSVAALVLSVASWPWLFAINVPLGLAVWWLGRRSLPGHRAADAALATPTAADGRFSLPDAALNIAMFALLFVGLDRLVPRAAQAADPAAPLQGAALLAAGMALGAWYARRQWHEAVPLLPIDLLRIPVFALSVATSVCSFVAQSMALVSLPFLLENTLGFNEVHTGLLMTPWPLTVAIVAPIAGRAADRYPVGILSGCGLAVMAAGLFLLAGIPAHPSSIDIAWRMLICGLGFGFFNTPNNRAIIMSAPPTRSGGASGMQATARLLGQTLGAALVALVFGFFPVHGTTVAMLVAGFAAAGAAGVSFLRMRTGRS